MRIVVALGGNALLQRSDVPSALVQEHHVHDAVAALAPLVGVHDIVLTHGNGPQVGLLALESARDPDLDRPYPFDVLGAQTQGMIGYMLLQGLENALPGREVVSLVCQTRVDETDPAFHAPSKFVGPTYSLEQKNVLASQWEWNFALDGEMWRRVVASPVPREILEVATISALVERGCLVICAGGGGIPVIRNADGQLVGVEAVVDKDLTASLLAQSLSCDALVLLTDVEGIEVDFGRANAHVVRDATVAQLRDMSFPSGSMGPKVTAVCDFVEATGHRAMIGRLSDAQAVIEGRCGTLIQ